MKKFMNFIIFILFTISLTGCSVSISERGIKTVTANSTATFSWSFVIALSVPILIVIMYLLSMLRKPKLITVKVEKKRKIKRDGIATMSSTAPYGSYTYHSYTIDVILESGKLKTFSCTELVHEELQTGKIYTLKVKGSSILQIKNRKRL